MTSFEEVLDMMNAMSKEEQIAKIKENKRLCICGTCPTYEGTNEKELLFCATKKSSKISKENGCTCPGCPLTEAMWLRWNYYCTRGTAKEQLELQKKK